MKLWVARDKDGQLCGYKEKPIRYKDTFGDNAIYEDVIHLDNDDMLEVTWDNSPQEVELKLVKR